MLATRTTLAALVEASGLSQSDLARRLGVTQVSVHKWVTEKSPLPASRVAPLAGALGVPAETLEVFCSRDPRARTKGEATTVLGEILRWDILSAHLGDDYLLRLQRVAELMERPVSEIVAWTVYGIPVEQVRPIVDACWPNFPARAFAWEATFKRPEREAIDEFIRATRRSPSETFANLAERVHAANQRYLAKGSEPNPQEALKVLNDGVDLPSFWKVKSIELARARTAE